MKYRVEQKYMITEAQIAFLQLRLESIMEYDEHAPNGSYTIRSLYFDDMYDSFLEDNEAGNDFRQKFRIRTYNNCHDRIHLEMKAKEYGYTHKKKERITLKECIAFMERRPWTLTKQDGEVKRKIYALMAMRRLQPVQIVEYERIPFVERKGNVRITFDKQIGGTSQIETFLDRHLPQIPLLPAGRHIMEVKYDEFLPDYIKRMLNEVHLQKSAFSKYYYARKNRNLYG